MGWDCIVVSVITSADKRWSVELLNASGGRETSKQILKGDVKRADYLRAGSYPNEVFHNTDSRPRANGPKNTMWQSSKDTCSCLEHRAESCSPLGRDYTHMQFCLELKHSFVPHLKHWEWFNIRTFMSLLSTFNDICSIKLQY